MASLKTTNEPILAVLNSLAVLSGGGAVANASTGAAPATVSTGLTAGALIAIALGWFLRNYVVPVAKAAEQKISEATGIPAAEVDAAAKSVAAEAVDLLDQQFAPAPAEPPVPEPVPAA